MTIRIEFNRHDTAWPFTAKTKIDGRCHIKTSAESYADAERQLLGYVRAFYAQQPPPEPKEVEL